MATATARPAAAAGRSRSRTPAPPAWLVGAGVLVAVLGVLPVAYLVILVAGNAESAAALALRDRTIAVLGRTLLLAGTVTTASVLIGVPMAWLTARTDLPGRRWWTVLGVLPLVVPSYVGGYAVVAAFGPRGALQSILEPLGIDRLPELYGFPGAALALTLFSYPYVVLSVRGALLRLDPAFEEVSRSLGRGPWRTFLSATLPQLRPAITAGALLVALYSLADFGAVSLLQFDSFTRAIYVQYRASFDPTLAAVLALMLVGCTAGVLLAESRLRGRGRYHRSGGGATRPAPIVRLGGWRWPALAFCATVIGLAVVVPVGTILFWLNRGLAAGEPFNLVVGPTVNSVVASGLAAILAVLASVPVAVLAVRHRGVIGSLVERATYAGFALPGIVIGLAFVFVAARYLPGIYQTLPLLLIAYLVRFAPEAVGITRSSLLQVSPRIEEVARTLGRRPSGVLREVTLPIIRPGLVAGGALVFLTAMKELPTTILLAPTGFDTLAVRIWSATSEGFFARAAGPALLMVLVAALSLVFVLREDPDR
ncbi:MAG TPA: iron ABC transporter permease [Candidatus Limnocylindrales bacterium]|nr:iron ABC transporter permease [Candidatus Limnocylindrales bacterium]